MNTKTDNQTASAPETRKVKGYVSSGRQVIPRTIPAEKATTQQILDEKCNRIMSPHEQAQYERAVRAEAYADKLAEALRDIADPEVYRGPESMQEIAREALSAYEADQ